MTTEATGTTPAGDNHEPSAFTYTLTPEQRNALRARDSKVFEATFDAKTLRAIRETYEQQGLVLIRGLFDDASLKQLCEDGQAIADAVKMGSTFTSMKFGPVFFFPGVGEEKVPVNGTHFREAALTSTIPAFVARVLFEMDDNTQDSNNSLRMLKDAFLAKGKEKRHCGWHVDDAGFWPTDCQSSGCNVWVALDDMPAKYGGGMAVSPKSQTAEWRESAYKVIGSTKIFPSEGVSLDSNLFLEVYGKTCGMETLDPDLNAMIESSKMEFDYQKGDCLFCTRWLFHRSVQINDEGIQHYSDDHSLKRYTIRYERGTAKLIKGLSVENCVLMKAENSGKSLEEVCGDGPFYPKCWPPLSDPTKQEEQMEKLVSDVFPIVEEKRQVIIKDITTRINKTNEKSNGY